LVMHAAQIRSAIHKTVTSPSTTRIGKACIALVIQRPSLPSSVPYHYLLLRLHTAICFLESGYMSCVSLGGRVISPKAKLASFLLLVSQDHDENNRPIALED
jgi:hypothetical protein